MILIVMTNLKMKVSLILTTFMLDFFVLVKIACKTNESLTYYAMGIIKMLDRAFEVKYMRRNPLCFENSCVFNEGGIYLTLDFDIVRKNPKPMSIWGN